LLLLILIVSFTLGLRCVVYIHALIFCYLTNCIDVIEIVY